MNMEKEELTKEALDEKQLDDVAGGAGYRAGFETKEVVDKFSAQATAIDLMLCPGSPERHRLSNPKTYHGRIVEADCRICRIHWVVGK